jgi:dethiobiotin synthetase
VASGSDRAAPGAPLRNADALELQAASSVHLPYDDVNPWCFEPAIAPHLAAAEAARPIELDALLAWYRRVTATIDVALVEGAGGWRVPLHPRGFLSDLPEALGLEVILVVGTTLGCLNHARLTYEAITASGKAQWLGWIANDIDPQFERRDANLATLELLLGARPLAVIAHEATGPRSAHGHPMVVLADSDLRLQALLPRRIAD